ncbi:hypothetical protein [Candidatus Poriferisocius sp.]|uniref:hypothetical protein n=1 Tax=Candidatus Poriferisocius sp. TaxID=3101276 RepID=UPI003B5A71F6
MSSVQAPQPTLARYFVASSAFGHDTDTLVEIAVHDTAGAAVVQVAVPVWPQPAEFHPCTRTV